jgi:hypothetical protein
MTEMQLLILQSILSTLQFINVGLSTVLPHMTVCAIIQLLFSGIIAGLQLFVQRAGNLLNPTQKISTLTITETSNKEKDKENEPI